MERERLIATVTAAQNGDSEALNELFNAFYNDVYYFALKTVKDDDLACDITQETFVEIINTIGDLHEPAAFVKWMKQITYHQCTRYFKKKKDVLVDEDEEGNTIFDTLKEEKTEFIPDEALDQQDFRDTILAMLDELSEEQRSATMLYYYDEMTVKQIAEIQNVSEGTVKSRLNYARKSIKNSVETYEKKNGVKLHCAGVLPLLLWLLSQTGKETMPAAAAQAVAGGVTAATGVAVAASTGGAVATATAATGTATMAGRSATTSAFGLTDAAVDVNKPLLSEATKNTSAHVAKSAAKNKTASLVTKLLAGALAASLAVNSGMAVYSAKQQQEIQELKSHMADLQQKIDILREELMAKPTPPTDPSEPEDTSTPDSNITVLYVPEGCTYITKDGTRLQAGEGMPQMPAVGDELVTEDYTYKYGYGNYEFHSSAPSVHIQQWNNVGQSGWGVRVNDKKKASYSELLSEINGVPLVNMQYAFYGCTNLVTAPNIPDRVTGLGSTFYGCISLQIAPQIPEGAESLTHTFYGCVALIQAPEIPMGMKSLVRTFKGCSSLEAPSNIPDGVNNIEGIFENCSLLKVAPVIPSTVKNMNSAFKGCKSLKLPPEIPYGVTDISFAFYDCKALMQRPTLPESITDSTYVFFGCSSLPKES